MKTIIASCLFFLLAIALAPVCLAATQVIVEYSQRLIPLIDPPEPGFPEGGIKATFTADDPVMPAYSDPTLVQVNDRTFEYIFAWNETQVKTVEFIDDAGDTTQVSAWPELVLPFDPAGHTVPVIHVRTDSTHLWDPATGIYVWGDNENCLQRGTEWERPATWDFYDESLDPVISQPIGLRIHGGWSRTLDQKGLRFYFDGYGDSEQLEYDFFDSDPTSFRRLIIRTGRYPILALNSVLGEGVFQDLGHLGSRFAFVAVYLNEEYWGVYNLRERIDEEFIEHTHDLGADGYILMKDGEAEHGDGTEFYEFLGSFGEEADYASHEWFANVQNQVDLITYIDWLFLNIFGASADNGFGDNSVQLKLGQGKWQFLAWDEDDLFRWANRNSDHFSFYAAADETQWNQYLPPEAYFGVWTPEIQQWCTMFNRLLHNSEFKALFVNRVAELLAGELSIDSLNQRIDEVTAIQAPEMDLHLERWIDTTAGGYSYHVLALRSWVNMRHQLIPLQMDAFLNPFLVQVELSQFSADSNESQVAVTWRTEREKDNLGFVLYRSIGTPDAMVEIASYLTHPELTGQLDSDLPLEYQFIDTTAANNQVNYYQLHHVDTHQNVTAHNWIESSWPLNWDGLVINELMADNESTVEDEAGEYDDWFELFNGSDATVYLDGLFVSDDPSVPNKYQLTGGSSILPGGHFLLWADNDLDQGSAHCGFKLSSGGESLSLYAPDGSTLIDAVTFEAQLPDVTFGRFPDGTGPWSYGYRPSPAAPNVSPEPWRLLVFNEILPRNITNLPDSAGDFDTWLEIFNPLPVDVTVGQLALSDDQQSPLKWSFPDTSMGPLSYLLVWADGEPGEGPLHTNFTIAADGGWLGLFETQGQEQVHQVVYPDLESDIAWAQIPDGSGNWQPTNLPTGGSANLAEHEPPHLILNEFLASNDNVNQDEAGDFEDWVEIFNPGPDAVQMEGLFLTDDLTDTTKWIFPEVTIEAGHFLLVWCDNAEPDGPLHADFKLSASGEEVGLFDRLEHGNGLIDGVTYGVQTTDISQGRQSDGQLPWIFFPNPTPGASNEGVSAVPAALPWELALGSNYPNPFNPSTTVTFSLPKTAPVRLTVHDVRGRLVAVLVDSPKPAGTHTATWMGRDLNGRSAAAGVYLMMLQVDGEGRTGRMVLLK